MKSAIKLSIPEPCHENWSNMSPVEKGRFCQSCQKTVVDFSLSTDSDILHHLANAGSNVCGRFTVDQLDRTLNPTPNRKPAWAFALNVAAAGVMAVASTTSNAQSTGTSRPTSIESRQRIHGDTVFNIELSRNLKPVKGVVLDSKTMQPIPFATVTVKGTSSGVTADEKGAFLLNIQFDSEPVILVVSCIGYSQQEYPVSASTGEIKLYLDAELLKVDLDDLPPVQVIVGMIVQRHEPSPAEKLEKKMKEWLPAKVSKSLRVVPNPVIPGNIATIEFNTNELGTYQLMLLDNDGRVLKQQQVAIQQTKNTVMISTDRSWSAGIYWVRLGSKTGKVYNCKLLLR